MAVAFTTSTGVSSTRLSYELEKVTGAGAALGGGVGGGAVIVVAIYSRLLQLEFSHVGREHPHVIPYFYCCTRLASTCICPHSHVHHSSETHHGCVHKMHESGVYVRIVRKCTCNGLKLAVKKLARISEQ